ncbi:MAG: hypothetical protein JWN70_5533 [Planctomycetaceae bacterium]|nr:hypothetical protein [Planctomycetaceae bacterium]
MKHGLGHRSAESIAMATSIIHPLVLNFGQLDPSLFLSVFHPCPSVAKIPFSGFYALGDRQVRVG